MTAIEPRNAPVSFKQFGAVLAVCAVLLSMVTTAPSATAASTTDAPRYTLPVGKTCVPIMVYAVRGSGEAFDDDDLGAGTQVRPLYTDLAARYGVSKVGLTSSGYPAVPVTIPVAGGTDPKSVLHGYKPSVQRGVKDAVADITDYVNRCHSVKRTLVIAGYSQGADVARRALARLDASAISRKINVSTVLYGDPNFDPKEDLLYGSNGTVSEHGAYAAKIGAGRFWADATGLGTPPKLSGLWGVNSWCHDNDPVCQHLGTRDDNHSTYAALDGYAAIDIVSPLPRRTPLASARYEAVKNNKLKIAASYLPPASGPDAGTPAQAFFLTTIDGQRVNGRYLSAPASYVVKLPTTPGWHTVAVSSSGHLLEQRRIKTY